MTAILLNGKALAQQIQTQLKHDIKQLKRKPHLAVILIGNDPASNIYVHNKQNACAYVGIESTLHHHLTIDETDLLKLINNLNHASNVDGILVQLPLPPNISIEKIVDHIDPKKDVDGFHPYNVGLLAQNRAQLRPCTPFGILRLLQAYHVSLTGLHAVILGRSNIVGKPLGLELMNAGCTVTLCHKETHNIRKYVEAADLLISATGVLNPIDSAWIREASIVIDVGIHRLRNGNLRGDLDFIVARERTSYITPVPGGVGPMTVAMLLENVWRAGITHPMEK